MGFALPGMLGGTADAEYGLNVASNGGRILLSVEWCIDDGSYGGEYTEGGYIGGPYTWCAYIWDGKGAYGYAGW